MESEYEGKWVAIDPCNNKFSRSLSRVIVLYCIKETDKMVTCVGNPDKITPITTSSIRKGSIIKIVPAEKVAEIRAHAKNVQNEYNDKREALNAQYAANMLNFEHEDETVQHQPV